MLVEHEGRSPQVDPGAWVAPTAVLCGDVRVAAGARVLWNAVLVDDGGAVEIGEQAIVMEQALLRGRTTAAFPPLKGDMENAGATFVDAPDVVDGNMVSCRGWPDMPEWSRAFMAVLDRAAVPA